MRKDTSYTTSVRSSIFNNIMNFGTTIFEPSTHDKIVQTVEEHVSVKISQVLQIGQLYIVKKRFLKSNKKYIFVLSKDCLYYSLSYPSIVGRNYEFKSKARINIAWLQTRFYTMNESCSAEDNYCIEIIKKNKSVTLMCDKINEYNAWVTNLSHHSIQTNFFKKFSVNQLLSRKDRCTVYKVTNKFNAKQYACKKFKKASIKSAEDFELLINEIMILRLVKNSNVTADIEEVHETDNSVYIVMELLEGGKAINIENIRSMNVINHLATKVLTTLTILEKYKVQHSNLTEDNIMLVHKNKPIKHNEIRLVGFSNALIKKEKSALFRNLGISTEEASHEIKEFQLYYPQKPLNDLDAFIRLLYKLLTDFYSMIYSTDQVDLISENKNLDLNHIAFRSAPIGCKLISAKSYPLHG